MGGRIDPFVHSAIESREQRGTVYMTAKDTDLRLAKATELSWSDMPQPSEKETVVFVDPAKTFQTIVGIGGALTDASAETFDKLPPAKQREILHAYFDPDQGIGYTLGRTHIHSCDFSSDSYTYVDDGDKELASLQRRTRQEISHSIHQASAGDCRQELHALRQPVESTGLDEDQRRHAARRQTEAGVSATWANYYTKFIKAYEREGIPIWGITVQNEPMATQTWESCIYTAEDERDFIKNFLGPTMRRQGLADKKIIAWDHNRTIIYQRVSTILDDPDAANTCGASAFTGT